MTQLVNIIVKHFYYKENNNYYYSLYNRYRNYFISESYEYEDAVQELLISVINNIDKYKPELSSVITWVDRIFQYKLLEQSRRYHQKINIFSPYSDELLEETFTLKAPEKSHLDIESLRLIIEEEPEKIFQNTHIKGYLSANFKYIFLLRLQGKSWKDIAKELDISISTLSSFFQRSLDQLAPKIREYLKID